MDEPNDAGVSDVFGCVVHVCLDDGEDAVLHLWARGHFFVDWALGYGVVFGFAAWEEGGEEILGGCGGIQYCELLDFLRGNLAWNSLSGTLYMDT